TPVQPAASSGSSSRAIIDSGHSCNLETYPTRLILLALPDHAVRRVLEHDPLREQLVANAIGLLEVLTLASVLARLNLTVDVGIEQLLVDTNAAQSLIGLRLHELKRLRGRRRTQALLERERAQFHQ